MKFLKKTTGETKKFLVCPLPPFFIKKKEDCILPHHMPPKYIRWSVNSTDQEMLFGIRQKKTRPKQFIPSNSFRDLVSP